MTDILHLPMGLMWNMPIPVACSLAVAAQGVAISCGQCPLDSDGRVLAPGDAGAQAALVAQMVAGVLSHLPGGHQPALLVVYTDAEDTSAVLAPLAKAFPMAELAVVSLPHFYYPGMRIEVDVYATSVAPTRSQRCQRSRTAHTGHRRSAGVSAPVRAGHGIRHAAARQD